MNANEQEFKPTGYCPTCGYNLSVGQCPECGEQVTSQTILSQDPSQIRIRWFKKMCLYFAALFLIETIFWVCLLLGSANARGYSFTIGDSIRLSGYSLLGPIPFAISNRDPCAAAISIFLLAALIVGSRNSLQINTTQQTKAALITVLTTWLLLGTALATFV